MCAHVRVHVCMSACGHVCTIKVCVYSGTKHKHVIPFLSMFRVSLDTVHPLHYTGIVSGTQAWSCLHSHIHITVQLGWFMSAHHITHSHTGISVLAIWLTPKGKCSSLKQVYFQLCLKRMTKCYSVSHPTMYHHCPHSSTPSIQVVSDRMSV